ncbi:monovalent cation/H+ antiporter complex subunit F [Ruania halotolerans]|uniref:monovalent cation/H+ antiporter complex subunit F n=1 Tax=Ruania halotolerans TaxID=2897773 RepID=UPI001E3B7F27|nr:monovalent cation/H+ antiporter complex subunit F [Ruania halotolerans]UFU06177.1 monovalent cation/H+ antiporter complex subunit F [Ruania halotolerans]
MSPIVMVICGVLLTVSAVIVVGRIERGPSMLDRVVGLDVLVAVMIGCLALVSLWFGREDLVLVLTVLALVGFVGSVTLARFAAAEPEDERRILTPAEAAKADEREREREAQEGDDSSGSSRSRESAASTAESSNGDERGKDA